MKNANVFLRSELPAVAPERMTVAPNISENKLNNAVRTFEYAGDIDNIVALYDGTMLKNGKHGLLFTGKQLIWKPSSGAPIFLNYDNLVTVTCIQRQSNSDSEARQTRIEIKTTDGESLMLDHLPDCDYEKLCEILSKIVGEFDEYAEERQLVPISEMSEEVKVAYVKALVLMAYSGDTTIDERELAEIMLQMTRIELTRESRYAVREAIAQPEDIDNLQKLVDLIDNKCPSGQSKSLRVSLAKDLINLYFATGGIDISQFAFFQEHREVLGVSDDEVELAVMAIKNDRRMLDDDYTDDQLAMAMKAMAAKAAAVGTPLAAVYLSGSVVGLSAAGMTSGLAALGLGGVLGLSGMVTGVGVVVLMGVAAHAGVQRITGANELDRSKRRELMLNEVIKQTQKTISLLIEDINYIVIKLNVLIKRHGTQSAQVQEAMRLVSQMTTTGAGLTSKNEMVQKSANRAHCARFLNLDKLKLLTKEPTRARLYDFILSFYEEKTFIEEKESEQKEITKLVVKDGVSADQLEKLAGAFEAIGYFNAKDVVKGKASEMSSKGKEVASEVAGKASKFASEKGAQFASKLRSWGKK